MDGARPLPRWVLPALFASLTLTILTLAALLWPRQSGLPSLGTMPAFALTNQAGKVVGSKDLNGKVLVVSLIYTNCTDICPVTTTRMRSLQEDLAKAGLLGKDAMLLSISVDPERDSPAVLARYAAQYGADTSTWHFLTGPVEYMRKVVVDGFMLGVEKVAGDHRGTSDSYEVTHSDRIVIVDKRGEMRTSLRTEELDLKQLLSYVRELSK